ncbi:MAG: PhnD/SsuA/transferrin family substrate-binding protein [Verrucomicrobia bacterium]|nr:PhnD/SsuA/transferrin family substrate-binding protein [Verrucomicrobiota bacterium]
MKTEPPHVGCYGFERSSSHCLFGFRIFTGLLLFLAVITALGQSPKPEPDHSADSGSADQHQEQNGADMVRIGIAPGTWGSINRNDASAAITAWAKVIMRQRGMTLSVETTLFEADEDMTRALRGGRVDAVSMLAHQFLRLDPQLQPDYVYLAARQEAFTERYVLLVHRAAGIGDLSGLRGGRLLLAKNARASLGPFWLDTLLGRQSLGSAEAFFKSMTRLDSPSKVVLQVFFRQAEACLITTNVFQLAGELNPQLHKELRVLAVSPEVVPALFCFRPGHASRARELLEPAIFTLHESLAGQQVLAVFQCEQMVKRPLSCFGSTRELLAEYDRLKKPPALGLRKGVKPGT